jgi:gas vesicle protein
MKGEDAMITEEQRKLDELTGKRTVGENAQPSSADMTSNDVADMQTRAQEKIKTTGEEVKAGLEQGKSSVVDTAQQLKDKVTNVSQDLKGRTQTVIEDGKSKVTSSLDGIASVLSKTAQELQGTDLKAVAPYGERLQHLTQDFSDYLKNAKAGDLLRDAEVLARRQPALFLGGAFALGLVAARFLKSSGSTTFESR